MKKYRLNAGIVVFREDGRVLLCKRLGNYEKNWQFPQGGIDKGETAEAAALRELEEETSIVSVKKIAIYPQAIRYDFPDYVKAKNVQRGIFNDGQEQYWFLLFFDGDDSEINLKTSDQEFCDYQWIDIEKTPEMVVDFKRDVYNKIVECFSQAIRDYLDK